MLDIEFNGRRRFQRPSIIQRAHLNYAVSRGRLGFDMNCAAAILAKRERDIKAFIEVSRINGFQGALGELERGGRDDEVERSCSAGYFTTQSAVTDRCLWYVSTSVGNGIELRLTAWAASSVISTS